MPSCRADPAPLDDLVGEAGAGRETRVRSDQQGFDHIEAAIAVSETGKLAKDLKGVDSRRAALSRSCDTSPAAIDAAAPPPGMGTAGGLA
eukprot:2346352-Prymnesium_polylepis.1